MDVATVSNIIVSTSPEQTFELGEQIGRGLKGGELILMAGPLGAGKTLLTKGILHALEFDPDDVTSPSFALVNLYRARFDVYHIDLWRLDDSNDAALAVGLADILENEEAVVIVEWADRLKRKDFSAKTVHIEVKGDGDEQRSITVKGTL